MKPVRLPSGSYRIQKMYKGKIYSVTFDHKPTEKEMTIAIAEKLKDAQTGLKGSFEYYANEYIRSRDKVISPATIRTYETKLKQTSKEFKKKNIYDIENQDVQVEINKFAADHAPKTVKTLHGFISSVLKAYRPNMRLNTKLPQAIKKDEYTPSEEDIKRILDMATGTRYEVAFHLGVMGMRRGEICALTLEDLNGNELWIHKDIAYINGKWVKKENPKTDASNRKLYLPDVLVEKVNEQGYFYNGHPNALNKALHRYQKELGIHPFTFHDLRHYFASYAHDIGISDVNIMAMGGWETDAVMKRVYRKSMEDSKKKANELFNNSLWG